MKYFTRHLILIILNVVLFGSSIELPIGLTDNEKQRKGEIYSMGRNTDPPPYPVRNIAEFEPMSGVLIRYPFGIPVALIEEMSQDITIYCLVSSSQENSAYNSMASGGVNMNHVEFVLGSTDSYWTRDYGPWWVVDGDRNISVVDFTYNRPRPNDNDAPLKISNYLNVPYFSADLIHCGGNYMTDGLGISASSELVFEENNLANDQVFTLMEDYYGIDTYHVVPDPNNTYIDHIDCWGKYLSATKVLIREVPSTHPQYSEIEEAANYFANTTTKWNQPWELYRVWTPSNQPYTNSLILNNKIFVPTTGSSWDDQALAVYSQAMPGYEVLGFSGSWESTDALHCRIKGIPDLQMLQIFHNPINDSIPPEENGYRVDAIVDDLSESGLHAESTKIFWKTDQINHWNESPLNYTNNSEIPNQWGGWIPALADSGNIHYYVQSADSSGRFEQSPPAGWHTFFAYPTDACISWDVGDLDNSGVLNIIDVLLLADQLIEGSISGSCSGFVSDVNGDNEITIIDILLLINMISNP
jgi:agmatine deiminase